MEKDFSHLAALSEVEVLQLGEVEGRHKAVVGELEHSAQTQST
jgi:hypothetical protein